MWPWLLITHRGPSALQPLLNWVLLRQGYIICEAVHQDVPWREDIVIWGFEIEKKGRIARPNTKPGLGVEIDEDEVAKHPYKQELLQRSFYADGAVGDW